MRYIFANNVIASLSIAAAPNDIYLTVDNGSIFPTPAPGSTAFYATLQSPAGGAVEVVLCTARNGNVLTVQRGADSTAGLPWIVGDTISMRTTAANLKDFYDAAYPITGGNLQGRMWLALDPTDQNEAATKNYVDQRTAAVFATNAEIDSPSPPVDKAVAAAGMRSVIGGTLGSLSTATKAGVIPAINELRSLVAGGLAGSVFWGVFDATTGFITWNPSSGQSGNTLPAPSPSNIGHYLICSTGGALPPVGGPIGTYYPGDWLISDGATAWYHLITGTTGTVNASSVVVTPPVNGHSDVQSALAAAAANAANFLQVTGGTMTAAGNIRFTVAAAKTVRIDGTDPLLSVIDHFTLDAGVF